MTMRYLHEAKIAFSKTDSNIYQILKDRTNELKKDKYITATEVVQILNNMVFIHANFKIEEEEK
jgi:hypothetical protein